MAKSKLLLCLKNQKVPFYAETGKQSLLLFLVILVDQDQHQMIAKKWVRSVHV